MIVEAADQRCENDHISRNCECLSNSGPSNDRSNSLLLRYMKENAKPELYQMTYTVDGSEGHFTVLWNRVLRTPPP